MLDILGKFTPEYRTFNLNKINIEDEGMEDLVKFNKKYKIDNSKCSLFEEIKHVNYYNFSSSFNDKSKINNYENEHNYGSRKIDSFFRIDFYLKRVIQNMNKPNIKKLILELGALSSNNLLILTKIKSIRSKWTKDKLVEMAVNIILDIINKDE